MGETAIPWTATVLADGTLLPGYTFNGWIGCTEVSPGCAHCYAARENERRHWVEKWGREQGRHHTTADYWKQPLKWARQAIKAGILRRVFCASLSDFLDDEVPPQWKADLFGLIDQTLEINAQGAPGTGLEWLMLTKRHHRLNTLPLHWRANSPDGVRIGVSAENQKWADLRIPALLEVWAGKNFVSIEPQLGPVHLWQPGYFQTQALVQSTGSRLTVYERVPGRGVQWVIVGGESGPEARPMHPMWALDLRYEARWAGVPFFFKQWGEYIPKVELQVLAGRRKDYQSSADPDAPAVITDGELLDPEPWGTLDIQGRWYPETSTFNGRQLDNENNQETTLYRVGRERAGATLEGLTVQEFPA